MNYKIKLYIDELENIYRIICVNDNIPIQMFIKSLIVSMNGNSKTLCYVYKCQKNTTRLIEYDDSELLSNLKLKINDTYCIDYDGEKMWRLYFEVLEKNNNLHEQSIKLIETNGNGICHSDDAMMIKRLLTTKDLKWKNNYLEHYKQTKSYLDTIVTKEDINKRINDYVKFYQDIYSPQTITLNISLEGYTKEIKRKILVNNNILIDKFCRCVIISMNGDLEHLYTIKLGKSWCDENILDKKLNFLELTKGQKFKVIYDFGDNWEFNVRVSKITDGYQEKEFMIEKGIGYGIVEDCGGIYGLDSVFAGENEYFEKEDINKFNLEKAQKDIDKQLKIENLHQK